MPMDLLEEVRERLPEHVLGTLDDVSEANGTAERTTALEMIDRAHAIASRPDVVFCSFGDMLRVPGTSRDLLRVRAILARELRQVGELLLPRPSEIVARLRNFIDKREVEHTIERPAALVADAVVTHGRAADLIVLSQPDPKELGGVESDFVEQTVMAAGRPAWAPSPCSV